MREPTEEEVKLVRDLQNIIRRLEKLSSRTTDQYPISHHIRALMYFVISRCAENEFATKIKELTENEYIQILKS